MQKIFKTIDEQVMILKDKGLIVEDDYETKEILLRENYFFLTGYRHPFLENAKSRNFKTGASFRELYGLFNFDRQLRNIIFKNILIVENSMKSIFSYELSKNYGYKENDYLRNSNFIATKDKARQVNDLLRKIKRQIRINGGTHSATTHYIYNYGYVPLWVAIKVLSFGIVCELYSIMKPKDQEEIAKIYGLTVEEMLTFLPILANYRNLCAHEDILYDHRTATMIPDTKYHELLNIPVSSDGYIKGKNDLFAMIIILKSLLRKDDFRLMLQEIDYEISILDGKLKSISSKVIMDKMGFPKNYTDLLNM